MLYRMLGNVRLGKDSCLILYVWERPTGEGQLFYIVCLGRSLWVSSVVLYCVFGSVRLGKESCVISYVLERLS